MLSKYNNAVKVGFQPPGVEIINVGASFDHDAFEANGKSMIVTDEKTDVKLAVQKVLEVYRRATSPEFIWKRMSNRKNSTLEQLKAEVKALQKIEKLERRSRQCESEQEARRPCKRVFKVTEVELD